MTPLDPTFVPTYNCPNRADGHVAHYWTRGVDLALCPGVYAGDVATPDPTDSPPRRMIFASGRRSGRTAAMRDAAALIAAGGRIVPANLHGPENAAHVVQFESPTVSPGHLAAVEDLGRQARRIDTLERELSRANAQRDAALDELGRAREKRRLLRTERRALRRKIVDLIVVRTTAEADREQALARVHNMRTELEAIRVLYAGSLRREFSLGKRVDRILDADDDALRKARSTAGGFEDA